MKVMFFAVAFAAAMAARADYWMTFCKTPGGRQHAQVGYAKPDADARRSACRCCFVNIALKGCIVMAICKAAPSARNIEETGERL